MTIQNLRMGLFIAISISMGILTGGCGSSSDSSVAARISLAVKANNAGTSGSLRTASSSLMESRAAVVSDFNNSSIASGSPDELTLYVTKMVLNEASSNNSSGLTFFENSDGKAISISGSRVDLSDMFSSYDCLDNNGKTYSLKSGESCDCGFDSNNNPVGKVTISRTDSSGKTATFVGCPWDDPSSTLRRGSGSKVGGIDAKVGTYKSLTVTFKRKATVKGCVTGKFMSGNASGTHSYCTQNAKAFYKNSGGGINSDFENKTAESMSFDLSKSMTDSGDTVSIEFPIQDNLTLTEGASSPVTLVIDTNRLLRFYNQNEKKEVNPGFDSTKSYFFTTLFDSSVYIFAGQPGNILGYQWVTTACTQVADSAVPADYICSSGNTVAGWLTVITNSSGNPIAASFMPDDDNTLTVIKGTNVKSNGSSYTLDSSAFTSVRTNVYDIKFYLGSDGTGSMKNVDLGVNVGSSVSGVVFRGLQQSHGTVTLTRKL